MHQLKALSVLVAGHPLAQGSVSARCTHWAAALPVLEWAGPSQRIVCAGGGTHSVFVEVWGTCLARALSANGEHSLYQGLSAHPARTLLKLAVELTQSVSGVGHLPG